MQVCKHPHVRLPWAGVRGCAWDWSAEDFCRDVPYLLLSSEVEKVKSEKLRITPRHPS